MDLGADFTFVTREERLAVDAPHRWAEEFSLSSISPENSLQVWIFEFKERMLVYPEMVDLYG